MLKIKFGTDGWRAIIAQDYTTENVARVTKAVCDWLKAKKDNPSIVIGHDCRFGGNLFTETAVKVFCTNGVKVIMDKKFVTTPMVSFAVKQHGADQGIVITASHNPPSYNGYKLKSPHGGPTSPAEIQAVEDLIPDHAVEESGEIADYEKQGLIVYSDLEQEYLDYLSHQFDLDKLRNSHLKLAYDSMYGAGQHIMQRIFPDAVHLHNHVNPSFKGTPPEPLHKNLQKLSATIANSEELKYGFANDGDADRIALYDEDGNYVDSHHIILMLIHYLHKYKKMSGKVAVAVSTSLRVNKMCAAYGLECEVTPVGFKYISEIMSKENVLVGGEESGGIAVAGHIPERDGIYDGILLYEFMNETGKTVKGLCEEIYEVVGAFTYDRNDLHVTNEQKLAAIEMCKKGITAFGSYAVQETITTDGYKFVLPNDCWAMVRASGTEPVLRIYAEGNTPGECADVMQSVRHTLGV